MNGSPGFARMTSRLPSCGGRVSVSRISWNRSRRSSRMVRYHLVIPTPCDVHIALMMPSFLNQLLVLVLLLLAFLPGVIIAGFLLQHRRMRSRSMRRSPLSSELLRSPGHQLRDQVDRMHEDVSAFAVALMVMPLLMVSLHLAQSYLLGMAETTFRIALTTIAVIGLITYFTVKLLKLSKQFDKLRLGLDAELAVGQELDQLMRSGAVVFHDFPAEKFNIDHIVICTAGVFAVETKGRAKPIKNRGVKDAKVEFDGKTLRFPDWVETKPLEQADRQARWLRAWLTSAVGSPVVVRPVLVLPGWYIDRKGRGDVAVLSGKEVHHILKMGRGEPLSEQDIQRIAHQVEQRCRNVAPKFNALPVPN